MKQAISVVALTLAFAPFSSSAEAPPVTATPPTVAAKRKPLVAVVLAETRRVPGYPKVRAYATPDYDVEPALEASDTKVVEVIEKEEALVLVRPYNSPLVGAVVSGARIPVKGLVRAKSASGCKARLWYGVDPFGYLCANSVKPTAEPATRDGVLQVPDGERLPFHYVMVGIKEGERLPMWASLDDAKGGVEPERQLEKGDTVAVAKVLKVDGVQHYVSVEGKVLPLKGTFAVSGGSEWHGEAFDEKTVFPFGWTSSEQAKVFAEPSTRKRPIDFVERRTRVVILEEAGLGNKRMVRIGEGRWLRAGEVNEVRRLPRPAGITAAKQWIDVDLGEQVLVAYEGEAPVYATLTSSGRAIATPRGDYPVWAKVSAISMKSQSYEDKAYFVNKVPWVLFFQAHNAIHGAYWHDRFGVTKSHGCINVAPLDARHLFEWVTPPLPPGWSGYRAPDLLASPTVHVRNSHQKRELVQERPIGAPDKELEAQKLEEAEERRAAAGAAAATEMKP